MRCFSTMALACMSYRFHVCTIGDPYFSTSLVLQMQVKLLRYSWHSVCTRLAVHSLVESLLNLKLNTLLHWKIPCVTSVLGVHGDAWQAQYTCAYTWCTRSSAGGPGGVSRMKLFESGDRVYGKCIDIQWVIIRCVTWCSRWLFLIVCPQIMLLRIPICSHLSNTFKNAVNFNLMVHVSLSEMLSVILCYSHSKTQHKNSPKESHDN
jgi:hypothetical protein